VRLGKKERKERRGKKRYWKGEGKERRKEIRGGRK
jgi:hypothetical protein